MTPPVLIVSGEHQYECHHDWAQLPEGFRWKNTHGVTIDREGLVYITHQGRDHPTSRVAGRSCLTACVTLPP